MMTALPGRGLFVAGAALLLVIGGVALAGAVGAASAPAGQELGPPVVVQGGAAPAATAPPGSPSTPGAEDHEHSTGPTVVDPAPAHEADADDDAAEYRTTQQHG